MGNADTQFIFCDPGDRLVAGDWGIVDGVDTPALFRPSTTTFFFRYTGNAESQFVFGEAPWLPVAGTSGGASDRKLGAQCRADQRICS